MVVWITFQLGAITIHTFHRSAHLFYLFLQEWSYHEDRSSFLIIHVGRSSNNSFDMVNAINGFAGKKYCENIYNGETALIWTHTIVFPWIAWFCKVVLCILVCICSYNCFLIRCTLEFPKEEMEFDKHSFASFSYPGPTNQQVYLWMPGGVQR